MRNDFRTRWQHSLWLSPQSIRSFLLRPVDADEEVDKKIELIPRQTIRGGASHKVSFRVYSLARIFSIRLRHSIVAPLRRGILFSVFAGRISTKKRYHGCERFVLFNRTPVHGKSILSIMCVCVCTATTSRFKAYRTQDAQLNSNWCWH